MRLPTIDVLVELQQEAIEQYGGLPGVKNLGNLEASFARAEHLLAYSDPAPDVVTLACGVCVSINRNHAFNDGNKRIAFIALGVLLELNGYILDARESEAIRTMRAQAANEISEADFVTWVRANIASAELLDPTLPPDVTTKADPPSS